MMKTQNTCSLDSTCYQPAEGYADTTWGPLPACRDCAEKRGLEVKPSTMDHLTRFVIESFLIGKTFCGADRRRNAMVLRLAKLDGTYCEVAQIIMRYHRRRLDETTMLQRDWQTKVSRRPSRGRHHDSWSIREKYVTCSQMRGW